jgi:energy-coupling factor transporter ATP-binding protein EcfA2
MSNITVIYGPPHCGKSLLAKMIMHVFPKQSEAVTIRAKGNSLCEDLFFFEKCDTSTELVIIDDFNESELNALIMHTEKGVKVRQRLQRPFTINPKILVLVTTDKRELNLPDDILQCRVSIISPSFYFPFESDEYLPF